MINKNNFSFSAYTVKPVDEIVSLFRTSITAGLTSASAQEQQKKYGKNRVDSDLSRPLWRIYVAQLASPFIALLCVVAVISMITENVTTGMIVIILVMINSLLGCYLEYSAQQMVNSLKHYLAHKTTVIRDGLKTIVDAQELVPGDVIELGVGDVITADVRFVQVDDDFAVDESVVTGESEAVSKVSDVLPVAVEHEYQARNIGFSGTTVVAGQARALVIAIGANSTVGMMTRQFKEIDKLGSFNSIISRFSTLTLSIVCISLVIIFAVHLIFKPGEVDFVQLLMFTGSLIAGIVPSSLPLITTFALSQGAIRLKRMGVIIKRLNAIIDLGSITVLCTDKTGTLTENVLKVVGMHGADENALLLYGALAGKIALKKQENLFGFESALYDRLVDAQRSALQQYQLVDEIPFSYAAVIGTVLVRANNKTELVTRGGVQAVLARCTSLSPEEKQKIQDLENEEGKQANRVLAVARRQVGTIDSINSLKDFAQGYTFLGLIVFSDPIKSTAHEAIKKAQQLGIKLKVLSGDSKIVCGVVAHSLGLVKDTAEVLTGAELEKATLEEKREMINKYTIFSRVSPQCKYEIISLLQEKNVVGYVGDGINDLLALKAAHVGIAVEGAVDSVKEVADIILLRKSLRVIVNAIEEGRYAFVNTMRYIKVMLSANLGNFYSLAIAGLFLDYLPMLPVQILLVDLLSNIPLLTFVTDRVSKQEIKKPNVSINYVILMAVILGMVTTVFDFIYLSRFSHEREAAVQTGWFIWSVLSELVVIFSVRTNQFFMWGTPPGLLLLGIVIVIGFVSLTLPYWCLNGLCPGQFFFGLVPVSAVVLSGIGALLCTYFIVTEIVKLLYIRIWNGYREGKSGKSQKDSTRAC